MMWRNPRKIPGLEKKTNLRPIRQFDRTTWNSKQGSLTDLPLAFFFCNPIWALEVDRMFIGMFRLSCDPELFENISYIAVHVILRHLQALLSICVLASRAVTDDAISLLAARNRTPNQNVQAIEWLWTSAMTDQCLAEPFSCSWESQRSHSYVVVRLVWRSKFHKRTILAFQTVHCRARLAL